MSKTRVNTAKSSKVSADALSSFFDDAFKLNPSQRPAFSDLGRGQVTLTLPVTDENRRPGGYISGPTQMQLADHAAYTCLFTVIGIVPMAVTSNLNIDFLRPCIGTALVARTELIKVGRTLAVMAVDLHAEGQAKLASRATVTYVIPQDTRPL